ncbi:MAG: sodium:alanine symporter family protein [Desulfovibrionaceae bacterium]|nr:sodium:alanine symporter family protein [Desulfovibrionaceae bacterium]
MEGLTKFVQDINSVLWGVYCLIPLLVGTGIYFSFKLKFVQIRKVKQICHQTFSGMTIFGEKAGKHGMSSFQSLATAIAAQVGTGNLAGAATAIALGGPGAIFWMWIAAFFGMATIFAEAVLAQLHRKKTETGRVLGGPAYYISQGLGSKFLAGFFAIAIIVALGFIGNMVQANSIADAFVVAFDVPTWATGILLAVLAGLVFSGDTSRIAATTEKMVPIMATLYLLGGLWILITNITELPNAFRMIFVGAFDPQAATGGIIGAGIKEAMRYGVARGLFSNEAGMGSTPHAHAVARVEHPVQQGFVAMMGVFVDTFVVLNMTALVIFVTGVLDGHTTGIALTQLAFAKGFGSHGFGYGFVAVCLFFFAFSTVIGWYFFAEQNVRYFFGQAGIPEFRVFVMGFIMLGSFLKVDLVWELADMFNGLMVIPNLIALWGLSKLVGKALDEYELKFPVKPSEQK